MKDTPFTAARLLALYDQVAGAEDAIPRLRRFVLDLAVRGKLVAQDASDEPAAELLKRLPARKMAHSEMPVNWLPAKLGQIVEFQYGKGLDKKLRLDQGPVPVFGSNGIVGYAEQALTDSPSIIVGRKGSAGALNLCDGPSWTTDVAYFVECPSFLTLRYLFNLLTSLNLDSFGKGVKPGLSRSDAYDISVALPPLAEQRRIVGRVEELMALCDQLQAARAEERAVRNRLTSATLSRLTAPDQPAEATSQNARFALQSLTTLTTRPAQIKALRQTILNLAVRGKLVEQDAADEPAVELLKRIVAWQTQQIGEKKIRAPRKQLAQITDEDAPYLRPMGWEFARLGQLIYIQSGDGLTAANMKDGVVPVFGGNGINGHHDKANVFQPAIVIGRVGYYCGSVHLTPKNAWVTDNAFITHFSVAEICLRFLILLLNGTNLKEDENATAQPVISGSKIYPIVVGLPPLAEQHRIVAKVDALMTLCDQLETSLTTTTTRSRLLEALLHEALEPSAGSSTTLARNI